MTVEFEEVDGETTRVRARPARLEGLKRRAVWAAMRRRFMEQAAQDWERPRATLAEEPRPLRCGSSHGGAAVRPALAEVRPMRRPVVAPCHGSPTTRAVTIPNIPCGPSAWLST
jgi:hypothetical protein